MDIKKLKRAIAKEQNRIVHQNKKLKGNNFSKYKDNCNYLRGISFVLHKINVMGSKKDE